ncbi:hypothetical protein EVAR_83456_1 [Eumeta japonica]|uniref:Uncharacterized protein n=1 Tax=Eumeta variegata TaxID=151549 RepID=A0A4C1TYI7_EUMVA|nr:hypothetical protein EVAR_83456_1 [Eumeta japonica]
MDERSVKCILYADHQVILASSAYRLQEMKANVSDGKVGKGRPIKSYVDHIGGILEKGQILNIGNRRACMKRLIDGSEAKEICKGSIILKSIASAYPVIRAERALLFGLWLKRDARFSLVVCAYTAIDPRTRFRFAISCFREKDSIIGESHASTSEVESAHREFEDHGADNLENFDRPYL